MRTYEYSSGSVTSLMSLQPCDSVSSPVEGTVFQLSTRLTLLPLSPYPWSVSEYGLGRSVRVRAQRQGWGLGLGLG